MKSLLIIPILLAGCATADPEVVKSTSRDKTMDNMARIALINEMLNSRDPIVRAKGAEAAQEFVKKDKSFFNWIKD
jgi:hypothetical protein